MIKVLRSSNFNVTTGMNFIFVAEPGFVSMCKHWRITHIKTIAHKGYNVSEWFVRVYPRSGMKAPAAPALPSQKLNFAVTHVSIFVILYCCLD